MGLNLSHFNSFIYGVLYSTYNTTYVSFNDFNLFSGGLAETPLHGGLVGPTFACIIGIQFRNLRKCDRFWYENGNPLIRFTEAQLAEIRKITLSKVICENCDEVTNVQRAMYVLIPIYWMGVS